MNEQQLKNLGQRIMEYCGKFNIPLEYLFEILEDQKVTPMIRGKAMEYSAFLLLESNLPRRIWSVQKLNLNPQQGTVDEDISITHRRSGVILKVETKSAVRSSMKDGRRARIIREPHFKVKCHRSRSNIALAQTTNDRYPVDSFDLLITNPLNAIFQSNTISEELEVIENAQMKQVLYDHYQINNDDELIKECSSDWRFCIPEDIAIEGFIPRNPYVKLASDPNWKPLGEVESRLLEVVQSRLGSPSRRD